MHDPAPEIHEDMPLAEYIAADAWSRSDLRLILTNPRLVQVRKAKPREPSDDMRQGSVFHTMVLEPQEFEKRYAWEPEPPKRIIDPRSNEEVDYDARSSIHRDAAKRIAEGRIEAARSAGLELLPHSWRDELGEQSASVHRQLASLFVRDDFRVEASVFWTDPETGVRCKARPDWYGAPQVLDVKRSYQGSLEHEMQRKMDREGLRLQAWMQMEGLRRTGVEVSDYWWAVCVTDEAHTVKLWQASSAVLEHGGALFARACKRVVELTRDGAPTIWPGPGPEVIDLPGYLLN